MIGSIILVLVVALSPTSGQQGCNTKVDVTFLLDSSDNVGKDNFQKQLSFVKDTVNKMNIAPDKVQTSVVTFSTGVDNQFYLNQYQNKSQVLNAISNIQFKGGQTHTSDAIRFATGTSFSPVHGGRSNNVPHVAIVVTNGPSGSVDVTKLEAQTARDNGVILYSVGVGSGVDLNELQAIASDPDSRHMFNAQNYDALRSLSDLLATKVCNELPPNPTLLPAPTGCLTSADLVFMVDSSSSVGSTNFQKLEHFLKDVVSKIDVAPNKVQVGMVKYGSYPSVEFPLGAYKTRAEAMKAIEGMTYLGGGTNDADAITYTGQQVFSQSSGARGNVPRIAVLITDGGSANPNAAIAAANKAKQEHIGLMTVGVGSRVDTHELNSIASSRGDAFTVGSYDDLDSITDQIISQMCKINATEPSLTTVAPGGSLPPDTCQDKLTNCDQYGSTTCVDYQQWAHDNCQRTCGICTPLYTSGPPQCKDNLPSCSSYGKDNCKNLQTWAMANCPLFCGYCGTNTTGTGYYGKCFYKGMSYRTGEKWYDGCDYECVCEDGNTGKYKCNNRCPVYHNLPTDCTLVAQPGQCCLKPLCNFQPTVDSQQSSGHGKTQDGIDVCVYKGKQYFQGQSWRDGCDYQCRCMDSKKGLYKCEDLCPAYRSIPPYCHLEQKAGECCSKPVCEFDSQTGSFQGSGSVSGNGVGARPTDHPPCLDAITSCSQYGKSVCTQYRGWAATNCRQYCDLCPTGLPKPGPDDQCIYQGKFYNQGDSWKISCDTTCTCENAIYGYYRCVNSCPTYNNLPNGCTVTKNAGDCCPTVQCNNGFFLTSSPNIGSIGNGGQMNISNPPPGMVQVRPTELVPGTGGTGFQAPSLSGCLYKGQLYVQNQVWEDGCDYTCECTQATTGLYSCRQKCPTYPLLQPSCTLVPDTNDVCCKTPKCNPDPVTHKIPVPIPVFPAAISSHGSVQPSSHIDIGGGYTRTVYLTHQGFTPAPPTASGNFTGGIGFCTYRGTQYQQGQTWEDGCQFNCVCDDARKGHYQCVEKCVHYDNLPSTCYLVKDPNNPCCDVPKCVFPVNYVTDVGQVITTLTPRGDHCVYNGKDYQQGQTWFDGCSYRCTCEDALNNIYRCLSRCPQYTNIAANCVFVPDPKDPSCCQMPECPNTGSNNNTGNQIPTPAPSGTYVGQGIGQGYCEYKGIHYNQGQTWQDGCDLNCECTDSDTGLYRCTDSCPRYVNLPAYCTLVTDFTNPCCKTPRCVFPASTAMVTGFSSGPTLAPTPLAPGATPVPGSTKAPNYKFCVYKGVQYSQGQTWDDGCQYSCRCDDSDKGLYTCSERCAVYNNIPAGCTMVTDPDDSCCLIPQCVPTPATGSSTRSPSPGVSTPRPTQYHIPTAAPGQITGSANIPTPRPGSGQLTPSPLNYCVYKGQQYTQGQKWDDGCEFTCECVDAHIGQYKCLEKCTKYVELPSNCRLARDPANPCCQVPECSSTPYIGPTPAPTGYQSPTPSPQLNNVCVYKGQPYTQGQTWYDGCDYVCDCENSQTGLYRCNNRCPTYNELPPECHLEPSSKDPLCCKEPKCVFTPSTNQTTGFVPMPTPPPGVITGGAATPTPRPTLAPYPGYNLTNAPGYSNPTARPQVCVYKGNQYQQGQKWKDGCLYNCECLDALAGRYRCTEMCPKYDDLPNGCRLISDYNNPCCKIAYCDPSKVPTPAPLGVSTPSPAPKQGCVYNGVTFKQSEQWNDGCDLQCVCEDEKTGFYRCNDRCNKYDVLPGCTLVTDPRDSCCKVPYCNNVTPTPKPWVPGVIPTPAPGVTYSPDLIPTPAPGLTYAPGMYPTWFPGMVPTPAPGATFAPNKIPTPAPGRTYAPGKYPTWVPGMVPTPAPGMTFAPNKIPTPAPGRTYAPGMYPTWVPGMVPTPAPGATFAPNKIPTPAPGMTYAPGQYPTWVPGMVPTPAPGMTFAPNKIPTPAPGYTYPPGQYPTWIPGMVPTPAPGATYAPNKIPTPAPGLTYAPGKYPTWVPGMVPTPAPGMTFAPNKIPTPAPGLTYAPGQYPTWVPGMVPTPAPGVTYAPNKIPTPYPGLTYAPGKYPTWVPGMVPTPAPGVTFAPNKIPTPGPGLTYAPGKYPIWVPGMVPTPRPGYTYPPYMVPTPAPGQTYAPGMFPTPSTTQYPTPAPGQTYPPYKPGQIPTPAPGQTYAPNLIPTPAPGKTYAPGKFPTWVPGMVPTIRPGVTVPYWLIPTPAPGSTYPPFHIPTWIPGMIPTPAPGVTYAPDKIPTPAPGQTYAPGLYPTYVPGMVPTPAPGMTYAPDKIPTPGPGQTYAPGKYPTWLPGMVPTPAPGVTYAPDKIPTPGPGRTYAPGQYPTYVPGMVPTPAPGVTYAPNKIPTPGPGLTYAPGKYPTWVPGMVPTPAPGQTYAPDKIPTPGPSQTYAPGMFPTWVPGMVPTPAPGATYAPDKIPTPGPGQTYAPGKYPTWVPGMVPTPAPGITYAPNKIPTPGPGLTYAPGKYPTWVPGMVPTPAPGQTYAPDKIPTPGPSQTYAPGMFPTWVPGMVPTPAPGQTYAPDKIPTPGPSQTYAPGQYPTWIPGMVPTPAPGYTYAPDKLPTPGPGLTYAPGKYPTYVPGMVPTPAPGVTYAPNKIPTPGPGRTYAPGKYPTWVPGMVPTPAPGVTFAPNKIPTPGPGQTYAPGQYPTWVPGMVPTPRPGYTYPPYMVPTPAPGQTYAPGMFPTPSTTQYPTPAPGQTYPPYKPGQIPTPAPGQTYAPNLIPTPAPGQTYAPGKFPTWVPGMVPTIRPGVTVPYWLIPTPAPGSTYPPFHIPTWVPGMIPTPAPGVTYAPDKVPTPAPGQTYAPGLYPTYVPGMVPTPAPGMTYAPNKIPTPGPGQTYAPGMFPTWVPGMVPTPAPGATYAPDKIPTPGPGQTYAPGKYPTYVPGMVPTPAPGVTYAPNKIPTPGPGLTYAPGKYPTWVPGMVPTPAPGQTYAPDKIPTPGPSQTYAPGMFPTWVPGMVPTPAPGATYAPDKIPTPGPGQTYAPGKYPTYVPGMVPTPAPGVTYAPNKIPTPGPGLTYAPGKYPTWVPGMVPTPAPGQTFAPNKIPTPGPGQTYPPGQYPTWVPGMIPTPAPGVTYAPYLLPTPAPGRTYAPGQYPTWVPGMVPTPAPGATFAPDKIPTPGPGRTYAPGRYPTWVPGMVPTPAPGQTFAPIKIPTPGPGLTYAPGMYPTWVPGMVPTPAPGVTYAPNKIPTPGPGRTYAPGQYPTWVPGMVPTPAPGVTYAPNKIPTPYPGRTYAPGKYPTWVPGMVPTPAPGVTFAPNMIPTPGPGLTYAPGKYPIWVPGMVPTPRPGYTYPPYMVPTPAPGQTYAPGMFPTPSTTQYPTPAPGQTYPPYKPGQIPTPAPGQTYAPNLIPTPAPGQTYAPGKFPTWVPGMVPTIRPGVTVPYWLIPTPAPGSTYPPFHIPTWIPGMIPTPAPGVTYAPDKIPTPAPGQTYAPGLYPTYVPGMVPTPAPGMTYAPDKIPTPGPGQTYAPGMYPTWVPGMVPTPAPGYTYAPDKIPTPGPGRTYAPGQYPTYVPGMVPTPAPGVTYAPNRIPTPGPGLTYAPGKYPTWVPGMVPTPAPGMTYAPDKIPTPGPGRTYAPGMYPTWVPGMVPTPAPGMTYAPNKIPTPGPGQTYAPGKFPTWVPGMVPTPAPGYTYAPDRIPTPGPGLTYAPGMYPTWAPGMIPTPAPGVTFAPNMIPTPGPGLTYAPGRYPTWVPGMVPTPAPGQTYAPDKIPTPGPGLTYAPGMFPVPSTTHSPTPYPIPTAIPGIKEGTGVNPSLNGTGCMYHGIVYRQGQKWQDGCQYDCECIDDHTGRYRCKERCPLYLNVPTYCRLVMDPNDACCKIPVCNPPTPTPKPTSSFLIPTAQPQPGGPTPNPFVSPTPQPKSVCVMNGQQYVTGQTWYNGCDQQCVCEDGTTGFYRCYDRCTKYTNIPSSCTMVADPKDPTCCEVPNCIPVPQPGVTITPGPPVVVTGVTGVITGTNPPTTPSPSGVTVALRNVCVYGGRMYQPGQKWQDGCKYECICEDGITGRYKCSERCASFPYIPPQCKMQRDPKDVCCFVPVCNYNQTVPTPNPFAPTPGPTVKPSPGVSTYRPSQGPNTLPPSFCVYNGLPFFKGQTWDDGCTKKCRCDDADNNVITCFDRCSSFNNIGGNCVMVSDPQDSCCQIPKCTYIPTPAPTPSPRPGVSQGPTLAPNPNPSPVPTAPTGSISGGPQPNPITGVVPTNQGYCEYKGSKYAKGQTWDDGCSYTCTCIDDMSGRWQCDEKCPRYVQIPSYCQMVQDPANKCCKKPYCPSAIPTPAPSAGPSGAPTPKPKDVCIMDGNTYTQGQKWYKGCQQICICNDGKTGAYTCNERCPTYNLQPGCIMVPDPRDPKCCQAPQCNTVNVTGVTGAITGIGTTPIPTPGPGPTPSPQKVCVYNAKMYTQGQRWQDGCQYDCECIDANAGKYRCTDRCPRYPSLPASCHLEYDPANPCCQKPVCQSQTPTPRPGVSPTPGPYSTPGPSDFCVYQGIPYRQGQSFNQGCDKICICEDGKTGRITCSERCKTYPALGTNCTLVTDPNDQCCQVPSCVNPNTQNPNQIVTGVVGTITGSNLPNTNNPYPGGTRNECIYNGRVYQQGQTWDDGCTYSCECIDANTGMYRCTEKCPSYPTLPSYCTLVQDPASRCCQKPYCTPLVNPTPMPSPGPGPTPAPSKNVCVYKGNTYAQNQQWYDDCNAICRCEDASNNIYRCQQRCAAYTSIQPGCTLVPDPKDPTCCEIPSCPIVPPLNPTPGVMTVKPMPGGVVTGTGLVPTPQPQPGVSPVPGKGCLYKGMVFHQGQKFDDGCDYECECLDDNTGRYRCVEKCRTYSVLPKQCVLIQDQNKPCCQVPYCDYTNPTPFPGGLPTPGPIKTPTPRPGVVTVAPYVVPPFLATSGPSPGVSPTPAPQGFCVYKGVYYTQGQTWDDGCSKKCRCEDVNMGYYTCSQRCRSYNAPASCTMRTDPNDACCLVPDCNGNIPSPSPLPVNTPAPVPGVSTTQAPVIVPTSITGSISGSSGGNPINVPYQPGTGVSGSSAACVYKGVIYSQGQKWQDGCNYNCECVDSQRGQYRCTDRCPKYVYLPPQCHYRQSQTDSCCQEAICDTVQKPTTKPPPVTPSTQPSVVVTVPTSTKCVYVNGQQYAKGATWQDSCATCECQDPASNRFLCTNNCPAYSGLPSFCHLIPDPSNRCCMKPECNLGGVTITPYIGGGTSGSATPPTSLNVLPVGTHQVITGYGPPNGSTRDRCVYKGTTHTQGQSWNDGCNYVCTCENSTTGMYRCLSKCPAYPTLPSYCKSIRVPGQCCPTITCDIPGYGTYNPVPQLVPTPAPSAGPGISTPNPQIILVPNTGSTTTGTGYPGGGFYLPNVTNPQVVGTLRDKCVYKNRLYNQGDTWDDGCDYKCECLDGRTGYYQCNPLCPIYNNLPSNQCYLVKAQGQCCSQPMCYDPAVGHAVNPLTSTSVFPVVGTFSGGFTGFRPGTPYSGSTGTSGSSNACVYKGSVYHKGDKWDDGCDFSCTCIDDAQGLYQCDAKCPTYTQIPPLCQLKTVAGSCCKRVECQNTQVSLPPGYTRLTPSPATSPRPTGNCTDRITNCNEYGQTACSGTYRSWAERNCRAYCSICRPDVTTPPPCQDKLTNCASFGTTVCSGIYEPWAKDNCRLYCGKCNPGQSTSPAVAITTPNTCKDVYPDCPTLGSFYCTANYKSWSEVNCRKFCGFCGTTSVPPTLSSTTINPYSWMMFLKGVSGAPGPDLYQLWHSGQTLNPTEPLAPRPTTEFFGHYKPDYSNHWKDYCIDQVKVSIYKQGTEKAYIIFDATGADKNSWFSANRIISSSWSDLKTAQKEMVSMTGNTALGQEYLVSGHTAPTDPCDSFGWMMVSTKDTCNYEKGDKKPSYYYAPGTTQAHWGFTNPGEGDVFTIQAHPTCAPSQTTGQPLTTAPAVCQYKGQSYSQGQSWQDGCLYNCSCEDAAIGFYRCKNLCPDYSQIPPDCRLITVQGQCCPILNCSVSQNVTPAGPVIITATKYCRYNGNVYRQNETWNVGCDQSCKCTDASRGFYQCGSVCLNWDGLPGICHLDDAPPGQCCKQPNCPAGVLQVRLLFVRLPQLPLSASTRDSHTAKGRAGKMVVCTTVHVKMPPLDSTDAKTYYSQIPPACRLNTVQGQCCPVLDCPNVTPTGTSANITITPPKYCRYNLDVYRQDETWKVGCAQSCTCTDASRGVYQCGSVCLNWDGLPGICHLDDAPPGHCCKQPKCPAGVIINIPIDYKNEYPKTENPSYNYV